MGKYFQQLPERIKPHVEEVTKTSGLPQTEDSIERIAKAWHEKRKMFDEQIAALKMEETGSLPKDNPGGALLLTYSGSLLSLGTSSGGKRRVEYASIGLRKDVPDIAASAGTELAGDIAVGQVVAFIEGPIKSSSPLFKIAVCGAGVGLGEQEKRIREATIFLTNGFVKINRTHLGAPEKSLGQFTMKSMASYVAQKNGLSQKQAKQVIEDFLHVVGSGALLGERVRLGKLGKLYLRRRKATQARIGRNPITGEEITIKAKPEALVPKMSFSRDLKMKASDLLSSVPDAPLVENDGGVPDSDHVA